MHLSATRRCRPVPSFTNHTPRLFEVPGAEEDEPLQSPPAMFGPMGMAVGSVVLPSATEPSPTSHPLSSVSKANETNHTNNSSHKNSSVDASHIANAHEILRTDSITVSVSESTAAVTNDNMMTGTNLLVLPRANPSYDMAFFLKTTGPAQPRSPNKGGSPKRMASVPKSPLRFLKRRRPSENLTRTHERYGCWLRTTRRSSPA